MNTKKRKQEDSTGLQAGIKYLGSIESTGEGLRHYFMLECEEVPYYDFLGNKVSQLPVYVSSGTNTKNCPENSSCIIPFFGIISYTINDIKYPIISPIVKADGINLMIKEISNIPEHVKQFYIDKFNTNNDYLLKVSYQIFLDIINYYRISIHDFIKKRKFQHYDNILVLNEKIKTNNIFGLDLRKFSKQKKMWMEQDKDIFTSNMITTINNLIKYKEYEKIITLLGSPYKNHIFNYINSINNITKSRFMFKASKRVSRKASKRVSRKASKRVYRKRSKRVSRKRSKRVSRKRSKRVYRKRSKRVSRKASKRVSMKEK